MASIPGTLPNSLGKLVNNAANSDVRIAFKASNVKYFAHKLILSARSDVFNTMFYGAVKVVTTASNEFEIADVEPEIFLELLTFMYTDQIQLNDENFSEIVYASHKYHIEYLDERCADVLNERLDVNNVCSFLNECYVYDNAVTEECLMYIDYTIDNLIKLGKLDLLCDDPLWMVMGRDTLRVKEMDLFEYSIKRNGRSSSETSEPMAKRGKMETIFDKVRFPTMSLEEFSKCFKLKPEIFSTEQISSIFKYCSIAVRDDSLQYSTKKRAFETQFNDNEIQVIEFVGTSISSQKYHELKFCVFQPLALCGIEFTTSIEDARLSRLDKKIRYITLWRCDERRVGITTSVAFTPDFTEILLPDIEYVLETRSECVAKLISERVAPNTKFNKFFILDSVHTIVKSLSFKLRKRKS